jgi:hypothetical protein
METTLIYDRNTTEVLLRSLIRALVCFFILWQLLFHPSTSNPRRPTTLGLGAVGVGDQPQNRIRLLVSNISDKSFTRFSSTNSTDILPTTPTSRIRWITTPVGSFQTLHLRDDSSGTRMSEHCTRYSYKVKPYLNTENNLVPFCYSKFQIFLFTFDHGAPSFLTLWQFYLREVLERRLFMNVR